MFDKDQSDHLMNEIELCTMEIMSVMATSMIRLQRQHNAKAAITVTNTAVYSALVKSLWLLEASDEAITNLADRLLEGVQILRERNDKKKEDKECH